GPPEEAARRLGRPASGPALTDSAFIRACQTRPSPRPSPGGRGRNSGPLSLRERFRARGRLPLDAGIAEAAGCSEGVGGDHLAPVARAEGPPGRDAHRILG